MDEIKILQQLVDACDAAGVGLVCKNVATGHYHIDGPLLVNYYPFSPKRTAYAKGTTKGAPATPEQAVALSLHGPAMKPSDERAKRHSDSRKLRRAMLGPSGVGKCCWCGCQIDLETSTIEHVVPIARGGLEAQCNRKLACEPCNAARGHDMPELKGPPWD